MRGRRRATPGACDGVLHRRDDERPEGVSPVEPPAAESLLRRREPPRRHGRGGWTGCRPVLWRLGVRHVHEYADPRRVAGDPDPLRPRPDARTHRGPRGDLRVGAGDDAAPAEGPRGVRPGGMAAFALDEAIAFVAARASSSDGSSASSRVSSGSSPMPPRTPRRRGHRRDGPRSGPSRTTAPRAGRTPPSRRCTRPRWPNASSARRCSSTAR